MSQTILDESTGEEVEVFTAAEVEERATAAAAAVRGEFEPKVTELSEKLTDAERRAQERSGEFATFRKLSDDTVAKLGAAERQLYENQLALEEERVKRVAAENQNLETSRNTIIMAKANGNQALADKMKELWPIIGVEATTPEQIEAKAMMVLGAISTTAPDLVATAAGFQGGSYVPPTPVAPQGQSYADTEAGKAAAAELGLAI